MSSKRGYWHSRAARVWASCALAVLPALSPSLTPLHAQDNVLDLRVLEMNGDGDVTYQNFIYARSLKGGRFLAQGLYLRIPGVVSGVPDYNEIALGGGVRAATLGDLNLYLMTSFAKAFDDAFYLEPALLVQDLSGRLTGSLYLQRYTPLEDVGTTQWLIDALEAQYGVTGPLAVGASLYAYHPEGGDWLTKLGPKLVVADRWGSTELRAAWLNRGAGNEFQLRRLWVF